MQIVHDSPPAVKSEHPLALIVRRLLRGTMDGLAALGTAFDRRALAVAADGIHDASLARQLRVLAIGAEEAEAKGCGCERRFDRGIALGLDAQRADAVEDGHYDGAFGLVDHGSSRLRMVASTAERSLSGRSEHEH